MALRGSREVLEWKWKGSLGDGFFSLKVEEEEEEEEWWRESGVKWRESERDIDILFTVGDCIGIGMMMKKRFYSFGLFHFVELIKYMCHLSL